MPFFTANDGARLHYADEGHGVALLCLPGLTRTGADFDYLAAHLPQLRLIRPDYRGRGRSDWTGAETYSLPQEAADVIALLDHLGLDAAAVIGTSRGGLIGMFLAATAPDRLRGLCLNDVGPVLNPAGLERIRGYLGRNPAARSPAEAALALERANPEFVGVPASRWREEAERQFRATDQGLEITYDPALRSAFLAAIDAGPADLWPMFEACGSLPLALIRGENSALLDAATADEMERRIPALIREDVPGRGHVPFLDEPESLRVVHEFLGRCL